MKINKFLIVPSIILLTLVSCQVQAQVVKATTVEASVPSSESTKSPIEAQSKFINPDNLDQLEKSASLQASTGAMDCAWSSDGSTLTIMDTTHAGFYEAASLSLLGEFTGDEYTALYTASPDASLAAYSLDGKKIQLYDFTTKADSLSITPDFPFGAVFFSPDGTQIAVESLDEIKVVIYDTSTGAQVDNLSGFETAAPVYSAAFNTGGNYLLWISRGTVQPMLIMDQILLPALSHEDFVAVETMSHDNSWVATAAAGTLNGVMQPLVTLWYAPNGSVVWQMGNTEYFSSLDFSAFDALLAAGTKNEVVFYDIASGNELSRLKTGGDVINSLGFSPDGKSLLTCSTDGIATIWKVSP